MTESALRKALTSYGLVLHKEPGGDGYMIASLYRNAVVAGTANGVDYTLTLDDAIEWLRQRAAE